MPTRARYQPLTLGTKLRERRFGWFTLAEASYEPGVVPRPHVHRQPPMTIVQRGSFGFGVDREVFPKPLIRLERDVFTDADMTNFTFHRDDAGAVCWFRLDDRRAENLRFRRIDGG
jgi:hypothetical protein